MTRAGKKCLHGRGYKFELRMKSALLLTICVTLAYAGGNTAAGEAEVLFRQAMGTKDFRTQKKMVRELAAKFPDTAHGLCAQGMLSGMRVGAKPAEEIEFYNKALKIKPDFVEALVNRGTTRLQLNDVPGAMADFNKAIEINPKEGMPYFNRGTVKAAQGDDAGALADFDKAISLTPDMPQFYYRRALHRTRMNKPMKDICADYKAAAELGHPQAAEFAPDECKIKPAEQ